MGILIMHNCGLDAIKPPPVPADLLYLDTGTTTVASKLSNTHPNPISEQERRFCPTSQRSHKEFPFGYNLFHSIKLNYITENKRHILVTTITFICKETTLYTGISKKRFTVFDFHKTNNTEERENLCRILITISYFSR